MRVCLTTALLASVLAVPTARAESEADRWNLADVYPSPAAWDADAAKLDEQLKQFGACRGHLGASAAKLRECLDLQADLTKRLYRMYVYANEHLAEDTGVPASLALQQKAQLLESRVDEASAFVEPEILKIGATRIEQFLAQDAKLRIHRYPLERVLHRAPHTLDERGEALVAKFGQMNDSGESAYSILSNADIPWPKLKLAGGEEITLDQAAYTKYRELPNRDDRRRVMDAFFGTYKTYERTMGVTLYAQMKQDKVYAEVRKYPDSIGAALDRSQVPVAVIDTLIAQTNANLPTLHRYFRLRAKLLGVQDMHYYDIYPPLVHGEQFKFTLDQAKQLTLDAVAPLGKDYVDAMRHGFEHRWMDAYPRPHKQSGAHMAGYAYDVHPYVLMNFNGDYESVTKLAHEWGHAMHSYLADRAQPFVTANYATFVAEIASTFNEAMLLDRMLKGAKTDDERLYYLGSALEGLRATYFRQAMFAEFEREVHARVDKGEPLTGDELSKTYCKILKRYHGDAVAIDDVDCVEWAYIPHFYNSFYVYQYATSIAASSLFAQRVVDKEPGALDRYRGLLRAGGSDSPYLLVKRAGVDLATPAPYQALTARMNRIMDEIEAILARRK
jgi:oligoendopeptidase F